MFIAVLTQSGGCDYTIGCGIKIEHLDAETMDAANAEVETLIESNGRGQETRIDGVIIYEVTQSQPCNIQAIYARLAAKEKAEQDAEAEEDERAEFERLRQKYGSP